MREGGQFHRWCYRQYENYGQNRMNQARFHGTFVLPDIAGCRLVLSSKAMTSFQPS
jgi:hypothetical protein